MHGMPRDQGTALAPQSVKTVRATGASTGETISILGICEPILRCLLAASVDKEKKKTTIEKE